MDSKESGVVLQIINKKQFLIEDTGKDALLALLSSRENQSIINDVCEFRHRIFSPLNTIYMFIKQVLSADKSCKNAVSGVIAERLLGDKTEISNNTGSYTKARQRLGEDTIHRLAKAVGRSLLKEVSAQWKPYGRELKVFDGTTLTLPDTKTNNASYPKHSNSAKEVGFPQVRLVAVMSLITGSVIDYALSANKGKGTGEISLLRSMLGCINAQDITLGDRLYCNFFLTYDLMRQGADAIFPGHNQRRYDFRKGKRLGAKDHITSWKRPRRPEWMSKETYKEYPSEFQIRELKVNGVVYVTTLLDASIYLKTELHALYKRRWEVELHLNSIKTVMGMDKLSCKTPGMIRKEIGIHFLAYNIIRKFILDACVRHFALPWQISFKATVQLLNQFMPRLSNIGKRKKNALHGYMLKLIVTNKIGNRPGRVEPRAVKQRPKTFPVLRKPRKVEQDKILIKRRALMAKNKAA